jgi:DNA-binding NarL/FixJ family response regulator
MTLKQIAVEPMAVGGQMRAALVTDQPLIAEGLNAVFERSGKFHLVAVYSKPIELLNLLPALSPELAIIDVGSDISFPFLSEVIAAAPACKMVLLSRAPTAELTYHAQEIGASAILPTGLSASRLLACLEQVENGETMFDYTARSGGAASKAIRLTKRESQLVALVSQGLKNKEIATHLGISEGTVKTYFSKLFQKVGANDRLELALFGLKNATGRTEVVRGGDKSAMARNAPSLETRSPVHGPKSLLLKRQDPLRVAHR